jgi:arabinoxylan arabinofuranohydrolase
VKTPLLLLAALALATACGDPPDTAADDAGAGAPPTPTADRDTGANDVTWDAPGAGNPVLPGYYADPTALVHDGRVYIFATTDGPAWGATEVSVWHSDDLRRWTHQALDWPRPGAVPGAEVVDVWAPDVVRGPDGRFYLYISIDQEIWAGVADHPLGPWRNLLDEPRPLVEREFDEEVHHIDAHAFIDDDGRAYLYWGSGWDWERGPAYFAPLAPDMHTFAEPPRRIHPPNFFEGPYMIKRSGRYLLMYSDGVVSEPSYRIRYAWAPEPAGPWTEPEASPILVTSADSTVHGPGHHSVLRWEDEDYLVYHRDANPHQGMAYRQVCIDRLEYDDEGLIRRVVPTHRGGLPPVPDRRPANRARAGAASASVEAAPHAAARAVDDNYGTRWAAPDGVWPAWWQVDLGSDVEIGRVRIEPEYATKTYRYRVEVSDDGERWRRFGEASGGARRGSPLTARGRDRARWVRVTFEGGSDVTADRASIWEVQVEAPGP